MNYIVSIPQNDVVRRARSARLRMSSSLRSSSPPSLRATARPHDVAGPVSLLCLREAGLLQGLGPERLLAAIKIAARHEISAEQVALAEGWISEDEYYRRLSRWLDVPSLQAPFVTGAGAAFPQSIMTGLAPGPQWTSHKSANGRRWIISPAGAQITHLVHLRAKGFALDNHFMLASPTSLRASLMRRFAHEAAREASEALSDIDAELSARTAVTRGQKAWLAMLAALGAASTLNASAASLLALVFAGILCVSIGLRLLANAQSLAPPEKHPPLKEADLPSVTIIVALYKEARIAAKLVAALDALDYPRVLLDIKLVIEIDDHATRAALESLHLPARYQIIIAPDGAPRTKPRALNIGLALARGRQIVVYDAEDEPEPDQLRKAAAAFAALPPNVACLQARLAIDNTSDGWLPKLFAMEYAALFDAFNPGLARLGAPVPLGGTSNHFRTGALHRIGGWDARNVTEDVDLGLRLARHGYLVEALDSTTHEEAPASLKAWMNQRRRWFKGWMQTLLTHSRSPARLRGELGGARTLAALGLVAGALIGPMLGPGFAIAAWEAAMRGQLLSPGAPVELAASTLWCALWTIGIACGLWSAILGMARRGLIGLAPWLVLTPVYWLLLSVAAWRALIDLLVNPYYWAKTSHGHARSSRRSPGSALQFPGRHPLQASTQD